MYVRKANDKVENNVLHDAFCPLDTHWTYILCKHSFDEVMSLICLSLLALLFLLFDSLEKILDGFEEKTFFFFFFC